MAHLSISQNRLAMTETECILDDPREIWQLVAYGQSGPRIYAAFIIDRDNPVLPSNAVVYDRIVAVGERSRAGGGLWFELWLGGEILSRVKPSDFEVKHWPDSFGREGAD